MDYTNTTIQKSIKMDLQIGSDFGKIISSIKNVFSGKQKPNMVAKGEGLIHQIGVPDSLKLLWSGYASIPLSVSCSNAIPIFLDALSMEKYSRGGFYGISTVNNCKILTIYVVWKLFKPECYFIAKVNNVSSSLYVQSCNSGYAPAQIDPTGCHALIHIFQRLENVGAFFRYFASFKGLNI